MDNLRPIFNTFSIISGIFFIIILTGCPPTREPPTEGFSCIDLGIDTIFIYDLDSLFYRFRYRWTSPGIDSTTDAYYFIFTLFSDTAQTTVDTVLTANSLRRTGTSFSVRMTGEELPKGLRGEVKIIRTRPDNTQDTLELPCNVDIASFYNGVVNDEIVFLSSESTIKDTLCQLLTSEDCKYIAFPDGQILQHVVPIASVLDTLKIGMFETYNIYSLNQAKNCICNPSITGSDSLLRLCLDGLNTLVFNTPAALLPDTNLCSITLPEGIDDE